MTKPTKWNVRPAKTDQPGHPLPTERTARTDQTGRIPRLSGIFAGLISKPISGILVPFLSVFFFFFFFKLLYSDNSYFVSSFTQIQN